LSLFGAVSGAGLFGTQFFGKQDNDGLRYTFRFKLMFCFLLATVGVGLFLTFGKDLIMLFLKNDTNATNIAFLSGNVESLSAMVKTVSGKVSTNVTNINVISGHIVSVSASVVSNVANINSLSASVISISGHNHDAIYQPKGSYLSADTKYAASDSVGGNALGVVGKLSVKAGSTADFSSAEYNGSTGVSITIPTKLSHLDEYLELDVKYASKLELEENEETIALACTSLYKKMEMIEEHNALYPIIESEDDVFNISDFNGYVIATFASGGLSTTKVMAKDGFFQTSDETLKDFIGDVKVDFEQLKSIPKKYYTWKDDNEQNSQIGTSAQKVKEVYPELVTTNELTGKLSVDYAKLSILSLKAIDMLHEENKMLKRELQEIKEKLGLK
jgi:hypothetical protein